MTIAPTSRSLHPDVEIAIKVKFGFERGRVRAWRERRKDGTYSDWKVQICRRERGSTRCKTLGKLDKILEEIRFRGIY